MLVPLECARVDPLIANPHGGKGNETTPGEAAWDNLAWRRSLTSSEQPSALVVEGVPRGPEFFKSLSSGGAVCNRRGRGPAKFRAWAHHC